MLTLKLQFLSALPPLDKTARLPLALSAALGAALAVQALAPPSAEPEVYPPMRRTAAEQVVPPQPATANTSALLARAMFQPPGPGASTAPGPDGLLIAGGFRKGSRAYAVVQGPGGEIRTVPVGAMVGQWRLTGLTGSAVLLEQGTEKAEVPFGEAPPSLAGAPLSEARLTKGQLTEARLNQAAEAGGIQ